MPLGDPGGGDFTYTVEGLPECIFMSTIPTLNIERAVSFYNELLGMEILYQNEDIAAVKRNDSRLLIKKSNTVGIDTGIYFGVDDPYDLHRRLIDEGVIFVKDPRREPLGVVTSFKDDDGNIIYAIETKAELKLPQ